MSWQSYNANPADKRTGDCTVRAISTILKQSWEETYIGLCIQGFIMSEMPSSNAVWGAYLHSKGFRRGTFADVCPECYTVRDFCRENPSGEYILAISGHVVPVIDGVYIDVWDSGEELPVYYWKKEIEK